ncbi:MAG: GNAT family N-acetyltransferase [bacterium]
MPVPSSWDQMLIRSARCEDRNDFARLLLISAPYFPLLWGRKIGPVLGQLFCCRNNLFSFENTIFAEIEGRNAGMLLGYDFATRRTRNLRTGIALFYRLGPRMLKHFRTLLKLNATIGRLAPDEYYLSNLAVYPRYRRQGIGEKLLRAAEAHARNRGCSRVVLDVEKENHPALPQAPRSG